MPLAAGTLAGRAGQAMTWKAVQLAGTKGIFLIRTLILARLLVPDDFGLLAIATVAIGLLMSLTDFGMTPALVQQPAVKDTHYDSAWTINLVRALLVSGVVFAAAPAIAGVFAEPRAADILRVLALKPAIDATASAKVAELARNLNYRSLAWLGLSAAAVETVVSIGFAGTLGVWALVAGALAGGLSLTLISYVLAPHRPRWVFEPTVASSLIAYGKWVFLGGVVAVLGSSLTQVVISRRLGAAELGIYFMAAKLAFLPHEVASRVVGDVAFSLYARIQGDPVKVARAFRSVLLGLATLLLPIYVLLITLAPWLVADILGARWSGTEPLIKVLAAVGIVGLFGDASAPLFRGLGRPDWVFAIDVWQSALIVVLLWVLTGRYGVLGAPLAWLIAVSSSQLLSMIFAVRILRHPLAGSMGSLILILLASAAGGVIPIALSRISTGAGALVAAGTAALCVTTILLWMGDRRFQLGLRSNLTEAFPQVAAILKPAWVTR